MNRADSALLLSSVSFILSVALAPAVALELRPNLSKQRCDREPC